MPRSHGRVQVSIWQDQDYRALGVGPQRLYLFLLSQPNVTHLGVLPITANRWADATADYTAEALRDDLHALARAGFVVVDEGSEEVLIRSLFRRDGVYKQPNVLRSAVVAARGIYSHAVRRALLAELDRVDLLDVPMDKIDLAQQVMTDLREALAKGLPDPSDPDGEPLVEGVAEPLSEGVAEGAPVPFPTPPTRVRACAYPTTPAPTPSPQGAKAQAGEPYGFADWYAAYPRHQGRKPAAAAYSRAARTVSAATLLAAAERYRDDPTRDPAYTLLPATWLNQGRWDDEGPARPQQLNPAEERHRRNLALVQAFAAQDSHQPELGA